jgi:hypothetical protein
LDNRQVVSYDFIIERHGLSSVIAGDYSCIVVTYVG